MTSANAHHSHSRRLPSDVWALGFVSLLMDASSELVHGLLPIFMVSVLGVSMVTVGWLEGIAEATASVVKVFSGTLSDRWRRRKPFVILGYGLGAFRETRSSRTSRRPRCAAPRSDSVRPPTPSGRWPVRRSPSC